MTIRTVKILQVDIMIGIAAFDIVINKTPNKPLNFNHQLADVTFLKLQAKIKHDYIRIGVAEAKLMLQAIRLAMRAVGTIMMEMQARPTLERLERFCNDI